MSETVCLEEHGDTTLTAVFPVETREQKLAFVNWLIDEKFGDFRQENTHVFKTVVMNDMATSKLRAPLHSVVDPSSPKPSRRPSRPRAELTATPRLLGDVTVLLLA